MTEKNFDGCCRDHEELRHTAQYSAPRRGRIYSRRSTGLPSIDPLFVWWAVRL